jgi:N-acyl-D-amino-acid deacylase
MRIHGRSRRATSSRNINDPPVRLVPQRPSMLRIVSLVALVPALLGAQAFDVLVRNGRVVDGMGNPWYRADIGIRGGKIAEIGQLAGRAATRTIDARDMVVSPGFIDMMGASTDPLLSDPATAEGRLRQGITTMMAGEGDSEAPQDARTQPTPLAIDGPAGPRKSWRTFAEYFALLERHGIAFNLVHNVGAAQVRRVVVGDEDKKPTPEQMARMKALVDEAMRDGAVGISTALIYPPGTYATTEELIELSTVAAKHGGIYLSHMRNESSKLLDAIRETIRIGEEAHLPVHVYHLKAAGKDNWPLMADALQLIADARARGLEVTADIYPYIRNGIGLTSFLQPKHYAAGAAPFLATLGDSSVRRDLRRETETSTDWENWYRHVGSDWDNVLITDVGPKLDRGFAGLSVAGVAKKRGVDDWNTFFDLVMTDNVDVAPKSMDEEQKHLALRAPFVMIDVDSPPVNPATAPSAHPRAFGTFPRVLAKYVREDKVIPLEEAVRKMTSLPANTIRLYDRGRLAPGMWADIVIFDPAQIQDRATFEKPLQYSTGIEYMLVNGRVTIDAGKLVNVRAGRVLRHRG